MNGLIEHIGPSAMHDYSILCANKVFGNERYSTPPQLWYSTTVVPEDIIYMKGNRILGNTT
jgi:hypothetical protein